MIIMLLKLNIIFSYTFTTSNVKAENHKVVDPFESYNFDVKSILIWYHTENILFFLMRQALLHDYYGPKKLYYFLSIVTSSNKKNSKLES